MSSPSITTDRCGGFNGLGHQNIDIELLYLVDVDGLHGNYLATLGVLTDGGGSYRRCRQNASPRPVITLIWLRFCADLGDLLSCFFRRRSRVAGGQPKGV